jgi:hypothetical protein
MPVNAIEEKMIARFVIGPEKLQTDLALVRDGSPGVMIKIIDDQSRRRQKMGQVAWDANRVGALRLNFKSTDVIILAAGEIAKVRDHPDKLRQIAILIEEGLRRGSARDWAWRAIRQRARINDQAVFGEIGEF